ncbi:NlpC/P60 family protein, partial [Reichenbachiella faecimaris]
GGLANNGMGGWDFWGGIAAGYGDSYNSGSAFGFGYGGGYATQMRRALSGNLSSFKSGATTLSRGRISYNSMYYGGPTAYGGGGGTGRSAAQKGLAKLASDFKSNAAIAWANIGILNPALSVIPEGLGNWGFNIASLYAGMISVDGDGSFNLLGLDGNESLLNNSFAIELETLEGLPYETGADGPDQYDCSGAVCHGLRTVANNSFGDYTADDLFNNFSNAVSELETGNVIFYDYTSDGTIDHITTVIGGGDMVHPSSGQGIIQIVPTTWLDNYTEDLGGTIYYREIDWDAVFGN